MRDSGWRWTGRLRELNAAQAWGCPDPDHYDNLPKDARIDIVAWYEAKWKVESINAIEAQQRAKAQAKLAAQRRGKSGRGGSRGRY